MKKTILTPFTLKDFVKEDEYNKYREKLQPLVPHLKIATHSQLYNLLVRSTAVYPYLYMYTDQNQDGLTVFVIVSPEEKPWCSIFDAGQVLPPPCLPGYLDTLMECDVNLKLTTHSYLYDESMAYLNRTLGFLYSFPIPATFDQYLSSIRKKGRQSYNSVRRKCENMELSDGTKGTLRVSAFYNADPAEVIAHYTQAYADNLVRWNDSESYVHIFSMLTGMPKDACYVTELSVGDKVVLLNIGYIYKDVYNDVLALPICNYKDYKKYNLGIYVIYLMIKYLTDNKVVTGYSLATGETHYKNQFLPVDCEERGIYPHMKDYTSIRPDFMRTHNWQIWPLYLPFYVKGHGWITEDKDLALFDQTPAKPLTIKSVTLQDALKNAGSFIASVEDPNALLQAMLDNEDDIYLVYTEFDMISGVVISLGDDQEIYTPHSGIKKMVESKNFVLGH